MCKALTCRSLIILRWGSGFRKFVKRKSRASLQVGNARDLMHWDFSGSLMQLQQSGIIICMRPGDTWQVLFCPCLLAFDFETLAFDFETLLSSCLKVQLLLSHLHQLLLAHGAYMKKTITHCRRLTGLLTFLRTTGMQKSQDGLRPVDGCTDKKSFFKNRSSHQDDTIS